VVKFLLCFPFASSVVAVSDSSPDVSTLRDVLFPCTLLLALAILLIVIVCVCRHRRQRAVDMKARGAPLRRNGSGAAAAAASAMNELPVEFPASSVRLVCDICDDHRFRGGRVYLGELAAQPHVRRPCRSVVVRTMSVDADEHATSEFWRDVDALHALRHPHVACVVGVTGRSEPDVAASVLLESCPDLLNLHQYIVLAGSSLDHATRLRVAIQIAAAMDYLASRGIVHGDLASRNVMMISSSSSAVAKLFVGLSLGPALFPTDYQTVYPDCAPLPVRWMAPEAIATGGRTQTTSTDVWSYGVTLWELYSAGCRPYEGFDDHELVELIFARQLLPCPPPPVQTAHATSRVYGLMVDCWAQRPEERPTFGTVLARLEQWQAADASVTAAGRCPSSSSRSNSTPSNSVRPSPYPVVPARTCHVAQPLPDDFQRPPVGPVEGPPQSELTEGGDLRSRGVNCMTQSSLYGRRLADDRCTSTASERRHNDKQLPPQPADAITPGTVDVL